MANYNDAHVLALRGAALHHGLGNASTLATTDKGALGDILFNNGIGARTVIDNERAFADHWRSHGVVASIAAATAAAPSVSPAAVQSIVDAAVSTVNADILRLRQNDRDILDSIRNANDNLVDVNKRLDSAVNQLSRDIQTANRTPDIDASTAVADAVDKAFGKFRKLVEDNHAERIIADAVGVRIINNLPALDVFGVDVRDPRTGEPLLFHIYNDPDAPKADPDYIWDETFIRVLYAVQEASIDPNTAIHPNVWLAGDKGTGKTQAAEQFAARTGRGFTRFNFHRHTEASDYAGGIGLVDGNTGFVDGPILAGIKRVGHITLTDEVGFVHAGNASLLQGIAEKWSAVNIGGIIHRRASGTIIFAADNTTGNRDETGRFKGTQEQNPALLDRFSSTVIFKFLPPNVESNLIQKRVGCSAELADNIVRVLNVARAETASGEIIDAPSLRQAFALATFIQSGLPADVAWEITVANKSPAESRAALDAIAASFLQSF